MQTDWKEAKGRIEGDYHDPEYISITVTSPLTLEDGNGKKLYTTYLISIKTTFPEYSENEFEVRRRYSDFSWLRDYLLKRIALNPKAKKKGGSVPELPAKTSWLSGPDRFDPEFIEERRSGLEKWINSVANHVLCRFEKSLHSFLQNKSESFKQVKEN